MLQLHEKWRAILRKSWTIRVAAFWTILAAAVTVAPLVSEEAKAVIGPWWYGGILFVALTSVGIARVTKQPGADL